MSIALALLGGMIQAGAANSAAKSQEAAANKQLDFSKSVYEDQKEAFNPYLTTGTNALNAYAYENGLAPAPADYQGFTKTPGYDFRMKQGVDAVNSGVGSRQSLNSGATLEALTKFGQDYASQEYGNYLNRLAGLADMGQSSAGMTASAGNSYAANAGNALANIGNAQAAGAIGVGNALNGGLENAMSAWAYGNAMGRNNLFGGT